MEESEGGGDGIGHLRYERFRRTSKPLLWPPEMTKQILAEVSFMIANNSYAIPAKLPHEFVNVVRTPCYAT